MVPELRLVRYFVAVAQERNITRAAERLAIAQPSLSTAVRQLEQQLGVELLDRSGRTLALTPAGELLLERGTELLAAAEALADEVRERGSALSALLRLGATPTGRYGVTPALLGRAQAAAPAVMIHTREGTTGALLRDVAARRLDAAVVFCAAGAPDGVELVRLRDEPAVAHVWLGHPLAARASVTLADLARETILVAGSRESGGFTDRVLGAFAAAGLDEPVTVADPYPDLGLQAVRERLGVVIYARSAFPPDLEGSAFVPVEPPLELPFDLAVRTGPRSAALAALVGVVEPDV